MFSAFGFFIVLFVGAKSYAEEDLQNNNGWKPLLNEQVLNLHKKIIETTDTVHPTTLHWNPILPTEEFFPHTKQSININPHDTNTELMSNIDYIGIDDEQNQLSLAEKKHNFISDSAIAAKIIKPLFEHRRQAKNIIDNQNSTNILHYYKKNDNIVETNMPEKVITKETIKINGKSNIYEVTEVSDSSEINDLLNVDQSEINENKPYFEPNEKTTTEKSLSNILLNILSNYNIRINDDLTNYALSRNKQNSNTHKQNYGYLAPIRTSPIRNSENYLPLDPLVAVFLSNYGFYLPGFYGFPGKYHNIYGYLASNNIHNNKPFGAYKIYSDTDSSH